MAENLLARAGKACKNALVRRDPIPDFILRRGLRRELARWKRDQLLPFPNLVKQRIVREYGQRYGLPVLVETGTYYGAMIDAVKHDFKKLYSIELHADFHARASRHFARFPHITFILGDSAVRLPELVASLDRPALFWLDAHYSSGPTARGDKDTPVERELAVVFASPFRHVILIDDAREFVGLNGYPTLQAVEVLATEHGYAMELADQIIRLTPRP